MRKQQLIAAACMSGLILFAAAGAAAAASPVVEAGQGSTAGEEAAAGSLQNYMVPAWGTVKSVSDNRILLNNLSQSTVPGEVVIQVIDQETLVLDAVEGFPVALSDLNEGDFIYVYLGPAMTLSLPPIANARMIICKAPADYKVPEYLQIKDAVMQEDGSLTLTAENGNSYSYHVPSDCPITPYLTRNMVSLADLTPGRSVLLWSDADWKAVKIVLFAGE